MKTAYGSKESEMGIEEPRLMWAAANGQADAMRLALESQGLKNNKRALLAALCLAARRGHPRCVELLIPICDPKESVDGWTPLRLAAACGGVSSGGQAGGGHSECVKLLIGVGDIDERGEDQWTALMWAARNGSMGSVGWLMPKSNAELEDAKGRTAETLARDADRGEVAAYIAGFKRMEKEWRALDEAAPSGKRRGGQGAKRV